MKLLIALITMLVISGASVSAQTTAFTYQGKLTDASAAANASYDFEFALFDENNQQIRLVTTTGVPVSNGVFTVLLDFDAVSPFTPVFTGANRSLQIRVKKPSETLYTPLEPRQALTSAPYAIRTKDATAADSLSAACAGCVTDGKISSISGAKVTGSVANANAATNATNAANAANLGGVAASSFVQTNTMAFVRNQTAQQTETDFNVSGAGTANIFNAAAQYNISGQRVLSIGGTENLFAGVNAGATNTGSGNSFIGTNAGQSNTTGGGNLFVGRNAGRDNVTGADNSFVGRSAGALNMTGSNNSFVGSSAGIANTTGSNNSFVGSDAGASNMEGFNNSFVGFAAGLSNTTGSFNSFVGTGAGSSNATGSNNTVIGRAADVGTNNLNYASAIGSNARVTTSDTIVIGKIAGTYAAVARPADAVVIPGNLTVNGTFSGSGANITSLNASNITSGTLNNARLGIVPIANGGTGNSTKSFVDLTTAQTVAGVKTFSDGIAGDGSALTNLTAGNLIGVVSISHGGTGSSTKNFVDLTAAQTVGGAKTFVRAVNTNEHYSIDAERVLGVGNPGTNNLFVGEDAGNVNAGVSNSFVGADAGALNSAGSGNSFFGRGAGFTNLTGANNTMIGKGADVSKSDFDYATAIGADSVVTTNNRIAMGRQNGFDTVQIYGSTLIQKSLFVDQTITVDVLGGSGSTALCRNGSNQISSCSSSLRYKTNVAPFDFGLNIVNQLRPISFDWKADGMKDVGFGAEEVAKINPLFVNYNQAGEVEGVKYDRLSAVFVNAFKEQNAQIERQQKQINELKQIVCALKPDAAVCQEINK